MALGNREVAQKMNLSENKPPRESCGARERCEAPKSDVELFQWYLRQADYARFAQYVVGRMYIEGRGVKQDELTGYMWLLLSEESATEVIANSRTLQKGVAAHIDREGLGRARRAALQRWHTRHPENGCCPQWLSTEAASEPGQGWSFAGSPAKAAELMPIGMAVSKFIREFPKQRCSPYRE